MPAGSIIRSAKNKVCLYSSAQIKVREATSNDPDGPSKNILVELAVLSQNPITLEEMLQILIKRINDDGKNWRHIFKSLMVFEFLCLCGNNKVINFCKRNRHLFESLKSFQHFDKEHRDYGSNVRDKAYEFTGMLDDEQVLKDAQKVFDKSNVIDRGQLEFNRKVSANSSPNVETTPKVAISADLQNAIPLNKEDEEYQLQKALELSKKDSNSPQLFQPSSTSYTNEKKNLLDLDFMLSEPISQSQTSMTSKSSFHNNISDGQINTTYNYNKSNISNTDINLFSTSQPSTVPNNTPNVFNSTTTQDRDLFGFPLSQNSTHSTQPIQNQYTQPMQQQYAQPMQQQYAQPMQQQYAQPMQQQYAQPYNQPYMPTYNLPQGQTGSNYYNQPTNSMYDQRNSTYSATNPFYDQSSSSSMRYNSSNCGSNPTLFTHSQPNLFQQQSLSTNALIQPTTTDKSNTNKAGNADLFADLLTDLN